MEAGPDEEIFELDGFAQAKDDGSDDLGMYLAYASDGDGYWYDEDELRDLNAILNDRFGPETEDDVNQPHEDESHYPTPIGNGYSAKFDSGVRVSFDLNDDRWLWLDEEAAIDLSVKIDEHFEWKDDETEDSDPVLFTKEDVLSQVTTGAMTVHEAIELYSFLNDEGFYDDQSDDGIYGFQVEDDPFVQEKGREWSFEADGDVTETPADSDTDGSNRVYHKDGSHTDDGSDDGESEIDPVEFQSELIERIAEKTVNPESSTATA